MTTVGAVTQQYVETITAQTYKQQQNQTAGAVTTWTTKQSGSDNTVTRNNRIKQ